MYTHRRTFSLWLFVSLFLVQRTLSYTCLGTVYRCEDVHPPTYMTSQQTFYDADSNWILAYYVVGPAPEACNGGDTITVKANEANYAREWASFSYDDSPVLVSWALSQGQIIFNDGWSITFMDPQVPLNTRLDSLACNTHVFDVTKWYPDGSTPQYTCPCYSRALCGQYLSFSSDTIPGDYNCREDLLFQCQINC